MSLSHSPRPSGHDCPDANRFRDFVNALPGIAWRADARTFAFTFVSDAAQSILGFPAQQWLDDPDLWVRQMHPDDRSVVDVCHDQVRAGRDHELVYRMYRADGRVVWLRDHVAVRVENGVPTEFFGVMLDVTATVEAERELQRKEEEHSCLLETLPDGFGVHIDGRLVHVNREFLRIVGATETAQVIGRRVMDFVHPDDKDLVRRRQAVLRAGREVALVEERLVRLDGQTVHVEVAATPTMYNGRQAVQVVVRDVGERHAAAQELRDRDARLRVLETGTKEAIWEWNLLTGELWTNAAHYELFHPAGERASYEEWIDRIHPADRDRVIKRSEDALRNVSNWSDEYRFRRPDGTYGYILDRGCVVPGPEGRPARMIGEMIDVTALRFAEEQRRSAEVKFRSVVENSLVGTYMFRNGRFVYINATGAAMFGYDVPEILAMSDVSALFSEEDRAKLVNLLEPRTGVAARRSSAECIHRDGRRIAVEFFGTTSTIDGEQCVIGTMLDITAHREAREELRRSEQRYRDLVEDVNDVIYSLDTEGRITSLNPAFERLTGFSRDEWIGRSFTEIFMPESIGPGIDHFKRTLAGAEEVRPYRVRAKAGDVIDIEASGKAKIVNGVVVGTMGVVRDVTARNLLERKVEESKRLDSLGQMAASIAHEFNNVLMSIQPFSEVLSRRFPDDERVTSACNQISQAVARGKRVSQQILRFANPKQSELASIAVDPWLTEALAQVEGAIPSSIRIIRSVNPACITMLADRMQLDQAFINLLFNARDAMPQGGTITVDVAPVDVRRMQVTLADGDYISISVSDNGTGISPDVLPKIFDPLFTTKRTGTGLGLSIVRKLIEAHGGAVTVESVPGKGTTFHMVLRGGEPLSAASRRSADGAAHVKRIVLVEDEPVVAEGTISVLRLVGIDTRHVVEGRHAVAAVLDTKPDAVVVDLNLPDMTGIEVCRLVERECPEVPVVIVTGQVESRVDANVITLMKPYAVDELLDAIVRARAKRRTAS